MGCVQDEESVCVLTGSVSTRQKDSAISSTGGAGGGGRRIGSGPLPPVRPGIYMIGNGAGTSRGITAAWPSGIRAGTRDPCGRVTYIATVRPARQRFSDIPACCLRQAQSGRLLSSRRTSERTSPSGTAASTPRGFSRTGPCRRCVTLRRNGSGPTAPYRRDAAPGNRLLCRRI